MYQGIWSSIVSDSLELCELFALVFCLVFWKVSLKNDVARISVPWDIHQNVLFPTA